MKEQEKEDMEGQEKEDREVIWRDKSKRGALTTYL